MTLEPQYLPKYPLQVFDFLEWSHSNERTCFPLSEFPRRFLCHNLLNVLMFYRLVVGCDRPGCEPRKMMPYRDHTWETILGRPDLVDTITVLVTQKGRAVLAEHNLWMNQIKNYKGSAKQKRE